MLGSRTPAALLDQQTRVFGAQLDGLYDGQVDAVHDARVATRRIRELLALIPTTPGRDDEADVAASFRDVARALGDVRDIDVQIALLKNLETHAPQTAPSLVVVRQDYESDRLSKVRRLIKTLEQVEVDALLGRILARHPSAVRTRLGSARWRDQLRELLVERARRATERIAHATGVYFPNRAHTARIALKRLRYAAEIAEATGASTLRDAIKDLRKGQEILGELHDRQTLADRLKKYKSDADVDKDDVTLASHVLEGEVLDLHARYLTRRAALRDACAAIENSARTGGIRVKPAIAVGGAIVVSGLAYARQRLARARRYARLPADVNERSGRLSAGRGNRAGATSVEETRRLEPV